MPTISQLPRVTSSQEDDWFALDRGTTSNKIASQDLGWTEWQSFNNQDLNSNPVDFVGLEAPGAGKIIMPEFIQFQLDAGTTVYDFGNILRLSYSTDPSNSYTTLAQIASINSSTDTYAITSCTMNLAIANDKLVVYSTADATQGDGIYYVRVKYSIQTIQF